MAKREKKISFRYILNESVKPRIIKDYKLYPIYIQVNYNRKNTKFSSSSLNGQISDTTKEFFPLEVQKLKNKEKIIIDIIRYEAKLIKGDKYSVKGLGDRLKLYTAYLVDILKQNLAKEADEYLMDTLSYRKYNLIIEEQLGRKIPNPYFHNIFFWLLTVKEKYGIDYFKDNIDASNKWVSVYRLIQFNWFISKTPIALNNYDIIENAANIYNWSISRQIQNEFEVFIKKEIYLENNLFIKYDSYFHKIMDTYLVTKLDSKSVLDYINSILDSSLEKEAIINSLI